jgi:pimeloyl-ACP methyl ester carboxylesterase
MDDLDVRSDAAHLKSPVLVVHDESDRVVPISDGEAIAKEARVSRFLKTSGLGHQRILRDPQVLDSVIRFVTEGAEAPTLAEAIDADLFYRERRW